MPYDVVAYEADEKAMLLSAEEEGFFHRLLRRAWMNGSIPEDQDQLAVLARAISKNQFRRAWESVRHLWVPHPTEGGRLINLKQESEREFLANKQDREDKYQQELHDRQSLKGKLSAEARARRKTEAGNGVPAAVQPGSNQDSTAVGTAVQPAGNPLSQTPPNQTKKRRKETGRQKTAGR
jgi:uncharacterized protein YdaU (DUF1376 family)